MEEKKQIKISLGMVICIIIIFLLIMVIGGMYVYYNYYNKEVKDTGNLEDTNVPVNSEKKEISKLYHIEDGEKYMIYYKEDDGSYNNINKEISFSYPVIDIASNEIKEINEEIYKKYQDSYNDIFSEAKKEISDEISTVAVKKNGKYYYDFHLIFNKYKIFENDKYLSIVIINECYAPRASGGYEYCGYVINKATNKLMSNKEILKLFGAENDEQLFIDEYNEYATNCGYDKISNIEDVNILIYDNKLMISANANFDCLEYYNNGKLEEYPEYNFD